ncbi:vWA domain-containing protein [Labilithrix luteola]|nr:VWA domain-containing protein [Labilithrix luteola]
MRMLVMVSALAALAGCAKAGPLTEAKAPDARENRAPARTAEIHGDEVGVATDEPRVPRGDGGHEEVTRPSGTWIGAAAAGEQLAMDTRETVVGVWVDVPEARPEARPPIDLALVVDTSGSMSGEKIANARAAAATLVRKLKDGDIVSLDAFSDEAQTVVAPTVLDATTRAEILRQVNELTPSGGTNMFAGLSLAEGQLSRAPRSHPLRRVVVISDGRANVGPSSPEILGALAERGLRDHVQVTSLGVGTDYDERTLDALAVRSNGRLYHLSEPREMASILRTELALIDATLASDAFVEVVPAPGVAVLGADGLRTEFRDGALRIPLGALHAGQHREALVRVRIDDTGAFEGRTRSLASVRLRFRDAHEGELERVQEVVARTQLTSDAVGIAKSQNSRTQAIVALTDVARTQVSAAARLSDGDFGAADKELEASERRLAAQALTVTAPAEKKRLEAAAASMASARATAQAMPAKPKAAARDEALKMNAGGMRALGF